MGLLLSLEMFFSVGSLFLFFSRQLLNRGLRRRSSPADLAIPGTGRKPYRNADVWHVRERTVRHPDSSFGGRSQVVSGGLPILLEAMIRRLDDVQPNTSHGGRFVCDLREE